MQQNRSHELWSPQTRLAAISAPTRSIVRILYTATVRIRSDRAVNLRLPPRLVRAPTSILPYPCLALPNNMLSLITTRSRSRERTDRLHMRSPARPLDCVIARSREDMHVDRSLFAPLVISMTGPLRRVAKFFLCTTAAAAPALAASVAAHGIHEVTAEECAHGGRTGADQSELEFDNAPGEEVEAFPGSVVDLAQTGEVVGSCYTGARDTMSDISEVLLRDVVWGGLTVGLSRRSRSVRLSVFAEGRACIEIV